MQVAQRTLRCVPHPNFLIQRKQYCLLRSCLYHAFCCLLVGVLLIVTVLISPLNFLCKIPLIGSLNFGKSIQLFLKSTATLCGNWNDCLFDFFLKLGNDARPLKKFWKELSKLRKAICKHWLFTSRNHSHSFLRSVNWAESSLYDNDILLPAYAICLHSKAKLYTNLTQPKCLSNSNFCSFVGEILYLKDFNIIANILLFIKVVHNIIRLQYRNSSPQQADGVFFQSK